MLGLYLVTLATCGSMETGDGTDGGRVDVVKIQETRLNLLLLLLVSILKLDVKAFTGDLVLLGVRRPELDVLGCSIFDFLSATVFKLTVHTGPRIG